MRKHCWKQHRGLDSTALKAAERAALLGITGLPDRAVEADVRRRSRDWSQVRPEWALANNAAFIAAPPCTSTCRKRTAAPKSWS